MSERTGIDAMLNCIAWAGGSITPTTAKIVTTEGATQKRLTMLWGLAAVNSGPHQPMP